MREARLTRRRWRATLAVAALVAATMPAVAHGEAYFPNSTSDDDISTGCPFVEPGDMPVPGDPNTVCTLRGAINLANSLHFDPPARGVVEYIQPQLPGPYHVATPLPALKGIYIEAGYTSKGHIELVGGAAGEGADFPGLVLAGHYDDISNIVLHGFSDGVVVTGDDAQIEYVYSGTNDAADGPPAIPNSGDGIVVGAGASGTWIGFPWYPAPAWASGNRGWGIHLEAGSGPSYLYSARVGLSKAQNTAIPNGAGGVLVESDGNVIGDTGSCTSEPNVGSPECTRSIISGNTGDGIVLAPGTSGNTIVHSYVGVDGTFAHPLANTGNGIVAGGEGQTIGDASAAGAVTVSGNGGNGVLLTGQHSRIVNAAIGTDDAGTVAVPNHLDGVLADDGVAVDGGHAINSSVIAGNGGNGIELRQASNTVRSSTIGRARDGVTPVPNHGDGVRVARGPQAIGGFQANVIADNGGAGVSVVSEIPGVVPTGVSTALNGFSGNGGLGIDLGGDGVNQDHEGTVEGPNTLLNHPVLTSASSTGKTTSYHGELNARPNTSYQVVVYRSASCDPSGSGEGGARVFLGTVSTDASGHAFFGVAGPFGGAEWQPGDTVTAVAYDGDGNTSEFSPCVASTGGVDLTVDQALTGAPPGPGRDFELVAGVTNKGNVRATSIVVTETLPANTALVAAGAGCEAPSGGTIRCAAPDLDPGARTEVHFLLRATAAGSSTNRVSVSSAEIDANPADNTNDLAFSTAAGDSTTGAINEAGPVFAQTIRLDPVAPGVTATLPSGRSFELKNFAIVPVGTVVDAGTGIAEVTARLPGPEKATISGNFRDAAFRVRQPPGENGTTEMRLTDRLDCATGRGRGVRRATKRRRHLWGDGKGRFRIRGRYVTAAVRGTKWRVLDTCDSSEVLVRRGTVVATAINRARPARRTLEAGQRAVFRR